MTKVKGLQGGICGHDKSGDRTARGHNKSGDRTARGHNKSGDRTVRGGSADKTKVEIGLRELDLLTRQKWRQDCERWIC